MTCDPAFEKHILLVEIWGLGKETIILTGIMKSIGGRQERSSRRELLGENVRFIIA